MKTGSILKLLAILAGNQLNFITKNNNKAGWAMPRTLSLIILLLSSTAMASTELNNIESLIQAGEHEEAIAALEQAKASPASRFLRARALTLAGEYEAAAEIYRALIKAHPRQPEAYNNLAVIYVQQGKQDEAQKLLEKAMTNHPGFAAIYQNLSSIYVKRAQTAYGKALQLSDQKPINLKSVSRLELVANKEKAVVLTARDTSIKPGMIYKGDRSKSDTKIDRSPNSEQADLPKRHEAAEQAMQGWASAWSAQEPDRYIAHYADDYSPYGTSREVWVEQRQQRIRKPKWIRVSLSHFQVQAMTADTVTLHLRQRYESDSYQDLSRKAFVLQQQNGNWKIIKESSLGFVTP